VHAVRRRARSLEEVELSTPFCDASEEMVVNLMSFAFPHVAKWIDANEETQTEPFPEDLRAALVADLGFYDTRKWETAAMKNMDVTVMPSTWKPPAESSAKAELEAALADLAEVLASQLGLESGRIAHALETGEAVECIADVSEAWVRFVDAGRG
jgi:hypothetical protein